MNTTRPRAVLLDDSREIIESLVPSIDREGFDTVGVHTPEAFLERLDEPHIELFLVDRVLHSPMTNGEVAEAFLERFPDTEIDPAVVLEDFGLADYCPVTGELLAALAGARFPEATVLMLTNAAWGEGEERRINRHRIQTMIPKLASDRDFGEPSNVASFIDDMMKFIGR